MIFLKIRISIEPDYDLKVDLISFGADANLLLFYVFLEITSAAAENLRERDKTRVFFSKLPVGRLGGAQAQGKIELSNSQ